MDHKNVKLSKKDRKTLKGLLVLEAIVVAAFIMLSVFLSSPALVIAGVGEDNVTVVTLLQVGNVYPEVLNVSIDEDALGVNLNPNTTVEVMVEAWLRDFNGKGDINTTSVVFFDSVASTYGGADDNNDHYTNSSCTIDQAASADPYVSFANCTIQVHYYANNATWNASVLVTDNATLTDLEADLINVNTLLALELPDEIDFGEVNATEVSQEIEANVSNAGNVMVNLSLSGYARTEGDGYAMNCSLGALENITINYERVNITDANPGTYDLAGIESNYTNVTSDVIIYDFDLGQRTDDADPLSVRNTTYWRIYVPIGVAGSCAGNVIFGAVQAPSS